MIPIAAIQCQDTTQETMLKPSICCKMKHLDHLSMMEPEFEDRVKTTT